MGAKSKITAIRLHMERRARYPTVEITRKSLSQRAGYHARFYTLRSPETDTRLWEILHADGVCLSEIDVSRHGYLDVDLDLSGVERTGELWARWAI